VQLYLAPIRDARKQLVLYCARSTAHTSLHNKHVIS
jgi:hypothetical protein